MSNTQTSSTASKSPDGTMSHAAKSSGNISDKTIQEQGGDTKTMSHTSTTSSTKTTSTSSNQVEHPAKDTTPSDNNDTSTADVSSQETNSADSAIEESDLLMHLHEGSGECILPKPGTSALYEELEHLCEKHNATVTDIQDTDSVFVRQFLPGQYIDMRMAFAGNVDAGKSSLVGVLTGGKLDDGRGSARSSVFVHKHEAQTGRTSAMAQHIIGFDAAANIINYQDKFHGGLSDSDLKQDKKELENKQETKDKSSTSKPTKSLQQQQNWKEIVEKSAKICTFVDVPGHLSYLKTTLQGLVSQKPNYITVVIGANHGLMKMTKEHISIGLILKVPMIFVITKIDMAPKHLVKEALTSISKIMKLPGVRKVPYLIRTRSDILKVIPKMSSGKVVPVILMSSLTGENVDLVRALYNMLPVARQSATLKDDPVEMVIDATYFVAGVGTVVSGIVHRGTIRTGDTNLLIGPDGNGAFRKCTIKSIQCKRVPVDEASAGQQATFALKKERRSNIRKGMVIVEPKLARACWEFDASIHILYHSTTIKRGYAPVLHSLCTRQAAKIIDMDAEELRTKDKARVRFRFLFRPAYLKEGETLILREGVCKAVGVIKRVYAQGEEKPFDYRHLED